MRVRKIALRSKVLIKFRMKAGRKFSAFHGRRKGTAEDMKSRLHEKKRERESKIHFKLIGYSKAKVGGVPISIRSHSSQ